MHHHQTTDDLYTASSGGRLSLWFTTKQSRLSLPNGFVVTEPEMKTEYNFHVKLAESQYHQEQDSSSTLSTEQSSLQAATSAKRDFLEQNVSYQPGLFETRKKREEDYVRPSLANGTAHYIGHHQVQMENHNQSLDCISYPFPGSYFGRITSAYDPNAVVYPQMMGIAPTRAVLPLDCTEGIVPIYVNAKQYHAILKRRKIRAKLEAQNKMTKSRKPYLHESRHRHALKRARGSGGRFLNTKNMQEPKKPPTHVFDRDLVFQKISTTTNASSSWGASAPYGSDVSCIFNSEDIFPQLDLGVSIDSLTAPDYRLALSVDGYARIGTAN